MDEALGGRDRRIGFIDPPDFREKMDKVKKGIKELKERYNIQDTDDSDFG